MYQLMLIFPLSYIPHSTGSAWTTISFPRFDIPTTTQFIFLKLTPKI
ncbi:hypothetical protein KAR48_05525 [bacterium]|nr:hypothetical protein [bacterium]